MKKYFILLLILIFYNQIKAQDTIKKGTTDHPNTFFVELGGRGGFYSLNYKRTIIKNNRFKYSACIGLAPFLPIGGFTDGFQVPFSVCFQKISKQKLNTEYGLGIINAIDPSPEPETIEERKKMIQTGHIPSPMLRVIINPLFQVNYCFTTRFFTSLILSPFVISNPCHKYESGLWKRGMEIYLWGGVQIGYKF